MQVWHMRGPRKPTQKAHDKFPRAAQAGMRTGEKGSGQSKDSKFRFPGEHTQLCFRITTKGLMSSVPAAQLCGEAAPTQPTLPPPVRPPGGRPKVG